MSRLLAVCYELVVLRDVVARERDSCEALRASAIAFGAPSPMVIQ